MKGYIKPLGYLVAVLLLVAGGALGVQALGNRDGTYRVTAYFEKAIGLFEKSDVTILGVAVGKVTAVEPEGDVVRIDMEISDEHKVPADAFAQVVPISVISDRYIELAPVYEEGPVLEDGAVLDEDHTQIPAELDDVFKQLKKLLEAIEPGEEGEPGALGALIVQLSETLDDRELDLRTTLTQGAELTQTLAGAEDEISGLLINLDRLFDRLGTRAGSIGTVNRNLAIVLRTLAESRTDIEETVTNLADLTEAVSDLIRDNGDRLGGDLGLAAEITGTVLANRASVEEALKWLPVVGQGVGQAYHGGAIDSVDVRDNAISGRCDEVADLPDEIKDLLEEVFDVLCAATPREQSPQRTTTTPQPEEQFDCDEGVRKVKNQLKKIARMDEIPEAARDEIIKPLRKKLRQIAQECEELGDVLEDPKDLVDEILEDILDELDDEVPGLPDIGKDILDDATENVGAAGPTGLAPSVQPGYMDTFGSLMGDVLGFVGWSR